MKVRFFVFVAFVVASLSLLAEPHCPGKVTGLPLRIIQRSLIVVPIWINQSGPYDFLVDTGAQISTVAPSLASELHLKILGTTGVAGAATYGRHEFAYLDKLQASGKSVAELLVVIQDLGEIKTADPAVRGILGDNFLEHFDLLIDNGQRLLCLDDSDILARVIKGERIAFSEPYGAGNDLPYTRPIIIPVRVDGFRETPLLLGLDSGSNVPMLHSADSTMRMMMNSKSPILRRLLDGAEQRFAVLPREDVEVGRYRFPQISFVVPMNSVGNGPSPREDGALPTIAFQRVFISPSARYVVLVPW
jgi:hypothetical protein